MDNVADQSGTDNDLVMDNATDRKKQTAAKKYYQQINDTIPTFIVAPPYVTKVNNNWDGVRLKVVLDKVM